MSKDVKMFVACNHYVNETAYNFDNCPKCYGKGFYFDIYFNEKGQPELTNGSMKLQQEILKILIEEKGSNKFSPEWGNELFSRIVGTKNTSIMRTRIELIINETLKYLKSVQENEQETWGNMSSSEIIDTIQYIEVIPAGLDGYNIKVKLTNTADEIITQGIII